MFIQGVIFFSVECLSYKQGRPFDLTNNKQTVSSVLSAMYMDTRCFWNAGKKPDIQIFLSVQ